MSKKSVIYRLWSDSTIVGQWDKPDEAHQGLADYIYDNPEEISMLHFAVASPDWNEGMTIINSVYGSDIQIYLDDLGIAPQGIEDERMDILGNDPFEYDERH